MSKSRKNIAPPKRILWNPLFATSIALGIAASVPQVSAVETARLEVITAIASRSGSGVDKRLAFAKGGLLRTGYSRFTYSRRYLLRLATGKGRKLSLGQKISVVIGFKGLVGSKGERVQYYLETYSGKKRQARVYYSIAKGGAPAITGIDQPGARRAYVVIVRAPK